MTTATKLFRQGDVLLKQVSELPKDAKKLDTDVVAYGEATGHHHRAVGAQLYQLQQSTYVVVPQNVQKAVLTHEEHLPIQLETGVYEVIRQREYDPVEERTIRD